LFQDLENSILFHITIIALQNFIIVRGATLVAALLLGL